MFYMSRGKWNDFKNANKNQKEIGWKKVNFQTILNQLLMVARVRDQFAQMFTSQLKPIYIFSA